MNVSRLVNSCRLVIDDANTSTWLDGNKIFYELRKDSRPDINPFDIDDVHQIYYMLENLMGRKTSSELNTALDNLKSLGDIYAGYANNVLGMIIKEEYMD